MRTSPGRLRLAAAAAAWLLAAGSWPALAGEADAPPTEAVEKPESEESADASTREPAPATASEESPEVFIPSEDISEDLSVRFPVDI